MSVGEILIRWTARVAVVLYLLTLLLRVGATPRHRWLPVARLAWTTGFGVLLFHVVCAFHYFHHWSHDAAYESVARQTAEVTGLVWGGGLYINYVFMVVWGFDVAWWWVTPQHYERRPNSIEWAIHGFMAFITLNATVVFATGIIRWIAIAGCLLIPVAYISYRRFQ